MLLGGVQYALLIGLLLFLSPLLDAYPENKSTHKNMRIYFRVGGPIAFKALQKHRLPFSVWVSNEGVAVLGLII